ncbi:uncharacterized protein LOC129575673 [Sitodiplosis mosellana]|uniref:uncharacterized protein LOC129575673 n=1 Tax=Sitodiplosis mosellana TaxID=263140 RepID=UPI0024438E88|nr:uncharacterized protein LOC129575673 [Sitodiplosis mosellana]
MSKLFAVFLLAMLAQSTYSSSVVDGANTVDDTDLQFTDEEIVAAIKFLEMAPKSSDADEIRKLMTDLCIEMNRNPTKPEDLDILEKSTEDPRLEGHKTQMWSNELAPHAITNSNVISLKRMCADIAKYIPK